MTVYSLHRSDSIGPAIQVTCSIWGIGVVVCSTLDASSRIFEMNMVYLRFRSKEHIFCPRQKPIYIVCSSIVFVNNEKRVIVAIKDTATLSVFSNMYYANE